MRNLNPIIFVKLLGSNSLSSAVLSDCPLEQLCFIIRPIFLGHVGFLALRLVEPVEDFRGEVIVDRVDDLAAVVIVNILTLHDLVLFIQESRITLNLSLVKRAIAGHTFAAALASFR